MKLKCTNNIFIDAMGKSLEDLTLTIGKEYEVYSLIYFGNTEHIAYVIINDEKLIHWADTKYFELVDGTMKKNWIMGDIITNIDKERCLFLGYRQFVSEQYYVDFVNMQEKEVDIFYRYTELITWENFLQTIQEILNESNDTNSRIELLNALLDEIVNNRLFSKEPIFDTLRELIEYTKEEERKDDLPVFLKEVERVVSEIEAIVESKAQEYK